MLPLLGQYILIVARAQRHSPYARERRSRGNPVKRASEARLLRACKSAWWWVSHWASLCVLWRHCKTVDVRVNEFRRVTDIEEWQGDVFTWWRLLLLLIWFCLLREIWMSRFMMTEITMSENNYSWKPHGLNNPWNNLNISAFKINTFIHV